MQRTFNPKTQKHPFESATFIGEEIKEFQKQVPLIVGLCNPGLKPRHWEQIKQLGLRIDPQQETLGVLINSELYKDLPKIEEISEQATKEYTNEKILTKIEEEWQPVTCELKEWKDSGTHIISGNTVDEVQMLLDDHIIKV